MTTLSYFNTFFGTLELVTPNFIMNNMMSYKKNINHKIENHSYLLRVPKIL